MNKKINDVNHFCTGTWRGKKYTNELKLANCYNSCRNNKHYQINEKYIYYEDIKKNIILYLFVIVLLFDIILKMYNIFKRKI